MSEPPAPRPACDRFPRLCDQAEFVASGAGPTTRLLLAAVAVATLVLLAAATGWWLTRRPRTSYPLRALGLGVAAGTVAGLAVVPLGLALGAGGHRVGRYGELLLQATLGHALPSALMTQHLLISVVLATVFVAAMDRLGPPGRPGRLGRLGRPGRPGSGGAGAALVGLGALFGALAWLVINSLALPWLFGQPTPWQLGLSAIWPSLLVHLVYGAVVGAVVAWDAARRRS